MSALPVPCSAEEAVARWNRHVDGPLRYGLGYGGYDPDDPDDPSEPDTEGILRVDCSSFAIKYGYKLPAVIPGFNKGPWSSVSDHLSCDSALEDALHKCELFRVVTDAPREGDLAIWPSIRGRDPVTKKSKRIRIAHVIGVTKVLAAEWDWKHPRWDLLKGVHCHSGKRPAVSYANLAMWAGRGTFRGVYKPEWASRLIRPVR